MLKPIEKQRVAEEIVDQLRDLILTGAYVAGDKLPPERNLAKELGVNRSSLREALKKLEHLGLVKIRQGDGTRVQDFMATGGIDLVSHLVPLAGGSGAILADVLEFRRIYGREVARLAALRCDGADLAKLQAIADAADGAKDDPEACLRLDFEFYVALTQAAKNRVFGLLINTTRQAVMNYASFFVHFNVSTDAVRRHHRGLLRALAKHDADAAVKIADTYLAGGAEHLLTLTGARPAAGPGQGPGPRDEQPQQRHG